MSRVDDMVNRYIRESLKGNDLSDEFLSFFATLTPKQKEYCGKLYGIMDAFYYENIDRETSGQMYRELKKEYENQI